MPNPMPALMRSSPCTSAAWCPTWSAALSSSSRADLHRASRLSPASGVGVEATRVLAAHGAHVVGTARDLNKARRATNETRAQAIPAGVFSLIELDLASLASIHACADELVKAGERFDVVIANAGVMASPKGTTTDGFETQFGTNYLGHFVFVNRIAGLINPGGRLVMVVSAGHRGADVDLDDSNFVHTSYDPLVAYRRSKTATILLAVEFDRRHRADSIRATALHPGAVLTEARCTRSLSHTLSRPVYAGRQTQCSSQATLSWHGFAFARAISISPRLIHLSVAAPPATEPNWMINSRTSERRCYRVDRSHLRRSLSSLNHTSRRSNQCDVELHSHWPHFGSLSLAKALHLPKSLHERMPL